jgi:hypothetical protein
LFDCGKQRQITFRDYSWFVHAIVRIVACGGIGDQLHGRKEYFFFFLSREAKKKEQLSCLLCLVFKDHITFS